MRNFTMRCQRLFYECKRRFAFEPEKNNSRLTHKSCFAALADVMRFMCDATTESQFTLLTYKRRSHGILQQDTRETRLRQLDHCCASGNYGGAGEPGCDAKGSRAKARSEERRVGKECR